LERNSYRCGRSSIRPGWAAARRCRAVASCALDRSMSALRSKRTTRPAGSNSALRPCGDAPVWPLGSLALRHAPARHRLAATLTVTNTERLIKRVQVQVGRRAVTEAYELPQGTVRSPAQQMGPFQRP
jgi:hypothetical protein